MAQPEPNRIAARPKFAPALGNARDIFGSDSMNANSVFITGGTGFIGRNLIAAMAERQVHVLVRPSAELKILEQYRHVTAHRYDGTAESVINALSKAKANVVFHLAAYFVAEHKSSDVTPLVESNILLGAQLLEGMLVNGQRTLINTGTSWQHFENSACRSVCLYAASKQAFESLVDYYVDAYGFNVATLKLFDTYGPRDPRPKLFNLLKSADPTKAMQFSEGNQLIDLVYIDDVIEAFLVCEKNLLESTGTVHHRFGVSSGDPRPLREVVQLYLKEAHSGVVVDWGARPYRAREVMRTWTRYDAIPGWQPKISLDEGISRLVKEHKVGGSAVNR
jgi:nucleoside-diphosphate-sugar epimerase